MASAAVFRRIAPVVVAAGLLGCSDGGGIRVDAGRPTAGATTSFIPPRPTGPLAGDETDPEVIGPHFGNPRKVEAADVWGEEGPLTATTAAIPFPGLLVMETTGGPSDCWGLVRVPIRVEADLVTVEGIFGGVRRLGDDGVRPERTCSEPALVRVVVEDERLRPGMTVVNYDGSATVATVGSAHFTEEQLRALARSRPPS